MNAAGKKNVEAVKILLVKEAVLPQNGILPLIIEWVYGD